MSAVLVHLTLGPNTYPLSFGANALRRLERTTELTLDQIVAQMRTGSVAIMQEALWAGLEGGRLKTNYRPLSWTIDEVGDLLDEHGGANAIWHNPAHPIAAAVIEAWTSAFPQPRKDDAKGNEQAAAPAPADEPAAP